MTFAKEVHNWTLKADGLQREQVKFVCFNLTRDVMLGTPVDTGRALGNWQPSIGTPINVTVERYDKTGASSLSAAQPIIEKAPGEIFYLTNNLPYIYRLEFEPGFAKNKQGGWVRYSIERAKQIAAKLPRS